MRQPEFYNLPRAEMSIVQRMRAKHKLWNAGRYLEHLYNSEVHSRDEQKALADAVHILANAYNSFFAN